IMKPLRGSNRNASKAPNTKTKGKKTSDEKKRKTEVNKEQSHSRPSKIKEEENWRQMSVSSLADLEKILDLSILATLARKLIILYLFKHEVSYAVGFQENLRAVVSALEKNEHEMNSLEHQCSVLRNRLQDQEEEAQEVLTVMYQNALPFSSATMARRLGEILQNRESLQDAQELLSLAHKQVDELLHPDFNAGITTHCLEVISP
uniref:Centromere protein Q n=1 Tax=Periophthalmus magnuspinnatus TaxID=409849 RepID=A0A3B3ZAK0_9GOBI